MNQPSYRVEKEAVNDPYLKANHELWDAWTRLHIENRSETYDLAQFRSGATTLQEIELQELGNDVAGKSLLHLQCHFGLDTLSWARMGARVTGVDFSEQAIALARSLADEQGVGAEFIRADVYDLPGVLDRKFDFVFTSYGVLPWLPDLDRWAGVIAHHLRPGGTFYMVEVHPIKRILMPPRTDETGKLVEYGYFYKAEPMPVAERGSYANPEAACVHTAYYWPHSLGEIVTTLCTAGLRLQFLHEFPRVIKNCCSYEETETDRCEVRLRHNVVIPHLFSIRATR